MEFVAGIENQGLVMLPCQSLPGDEIGTHIMTGLVLTPVLHHDSTYLLVHIEHTHTVIIHSHRQLLVTVIMVYIGIGRHIQTYAHQWFHHIELHLQHLFVVQVFVNDGQTIVATHLQPAPVVRYCQPVVRIHHGSIDAVLVVLYGIVIEPHQPVALKQFVGHGPVCLTMLQMVHETVVVVRQLVETDLHPVTTTQLHDRTVHPVTIHDAGQRTHILRKYPVAGPPCQGCQH